ncbi:MAG: purine-nucleoside phosphorylase, partial [bacterium]
MSLARSVLPSDAALAICEVSGIPRAPLAIVLGSGLALREPFTRDASVPYAQIPGFPTTSVAGHKGTLSVFGHPALGQLLVMEGRPHCYEGWTMDEVAFPVRLLAALGVETVILTNAAGGINPAYRVGEFVALRDHVSLLPQSLTITDGNTWAGWHEGHGQSPYDSAARARLQSAWPAECPALREGVYFAVLGPNYETPAEIAAFATLGADLIGMSTATEAAVAAQLGLHVIGLSLVTNSLAGPPSGPLTHLEVLEAGHAAAA